MPVSQNGYSANDRSMIGSYTVPGTTLRIALRKGDVSVVLLEFLRRYHLEVESLYHTPQDLWGYAERTIRGDSVTLSNHASGTASDARAVAHPLGKRGTYTPAQVTALRRLLADFGSVLRWGGDYTGRPDEMHVEINAGAAAVRRVADRIRGTAAPSPRPRPTPAPARQEDPMTPEDRRYFDQRFADLWSLFGVRQDEQGVWRDRLTDLWDQSRALEARIDEMRRAVAALERGPQPDDVDVTIRRLAP